MTLKQIFTLLAVLGLVFVPTIIQAETVNTARWDSYCKANPRKCDRAINMCEHTMTLSCEEIKNAFLSNRSLPKVGRTKSATKPKQK